MPSTSLTNSTLIYPTDSPNTFCCISNGHLKCDIWKSKIIIYPLLPPPTKPYSSIKGSSFFHLLKPLEAFFNLLSCIPYSICQLLHFQSTYKISLSLTFIVPALSWVTTASFLIDVIAMATTGFVAFSLPPFDLFLTEPQQYHCLRLG